MTDPDQSLALALEPYRDEIDDVVELLEVVIDCWHDRADSYRRLECEREADQVELCASEIESLVLGQAIDDYDPDVERGDGVATDGSGDVPDEFGDEWPKPWDEIQPSPDTDQFTVRSMSDKYIQYGTTMRGYQGTLYVPVDVGRETDENRDLWLPLERYLTTAATGALEQLHDDQDVERGAGPIPDGSGSAREQDQLVDEPDDQDGDDDQDQDRPTCAYGACDEPAIEIYAIRSPTGPFDMPACEDHAPENKTPDEQLVDVATDGGRDQLLEDLAAIEHDQWCGWSRSLANSEQISDERLDRWRDYWVPYDELDDDVQDHDRVWARKVIETVDEYVDEDLLEHA